MIRTYVGRVNNRRVEIRGETLIDAMERAGYIPRTKATSTGRILGILSTGQRYTFRIAPDSSFHKPVTNDKHPSQDHDR